MFDPDLRRIARYVPKGLVRGKLSLWAVRKAMSASSRLRRSGDVEITRLKDGVPVRLHRPAPSDGPLPAVLWIHGGGYVLGSARGDDGLCDRLARELHCIVVAVDYRLAPEHPFPAALDDCHAALTWIASQDDIDNDRIAIAGASAGGGLAAALALRARDEGRIHPVLQLLVYPMLDDRTIDAPPTPTPFRMWNPAANRFGWTCYLGTHAGGPGVPDHAAPARRVDLSGLPPAWIGVGTLDLFHDENLTYAQRLQTANVPTTLHIAEGAFHGFDVVAPRAAISLAFRTAQVDALRTAFAGAAFGH